MVISFRSIKSVPHQIVNKLSAELLKFKQDVLLICFRLCQIWSFIGLLSGSLITSADDVVAQMVANQFRCIYFSNENRTKIERDHHGGWCIFGFISVARHFSEQFLFPCDFLPSPLYLLLVSYLLDPVLCFKRYRLTQTQECITQDVDSSLARFDYCSVRSRYSHHKIHTHTHRGYGHSLNLLRNALRIIWLELRRKSCWNQSREKIG